MLKHEILDNQFAENTLAVYDRFLALDDARFLISLLESNHIQHEVENPKQIMDTVLGGDGNNYIPKIFVKVPLKDFERVNRLVEEEMGRLIQVGKINLKDHFLSDYTDEELLDVVRKPDEWSYDTTVIARHLLESRGVELKQEQIKAMQEERIQTIRQPKKGSVGWISSLFALGALGPFLMFLTWAGYLGVICICFGMGYYFWKDMATDPRGERYFTFDKATQRSGQQIVILTAVVNVVLWAWLFLRPH